MGSRAKSLAVSVAVSVAVSMAQLCALQRLCCSSAHCCAAASVFRDAWEEWHRNSQVPAVLPVLPVPMVAVGQHDGSHSGSLPQLCLVELIMGH